MSTRVRIAIIGSGPGGLSAAGRAAELGVSHVLLEAEAAPAHTIRRYQKGKHVMAEPGVLPLRSPVGFEAGSREQVLATWENDAARLGVQVRYGARVTGLTGARGDFTITLASGETLQAETVVLAIGVQGNPRRLGVPGEDHARVQYQLDDPGEYEDETIVVVGGGDAAIENALALAPRNRVLLVYRGEEFNRCKEGNHDLLQAALREGALEARLGRAPARLASGDDALPLRLQLRTPQGEETLACHRIIARLGATPPRALVEGFGVRFPSDDPAAVPELSAQYESNVPGLYIVGALGGYPLIKQAMNQGYEVVEYILGNPVEPADEALLRGKFSGLWQPPTVNEAIARIRRDIPLLSGLTTLQLREFLLDSQVHMPAEGTVLFQRNDYSNSLYCILQGQVRARSPGSSGREEDHVLGTGDFFGEMGLISGRRRSATVTAGRDAILIETPRRSMLRLLASVESVRRTLDAVSLKRVARATLAGSLSDEALDRLVQGAAIRAFGAGEVLFNQGDAADGVYLLRRGSVTVARRIGGREVVLSYVAAGNVIGEMSLLSGAPRSATVRAAVATEAVWLPTARVTEALAGSETMRGELGAMFLERLRENEAMAEHAESGHLISFLMQQGIGEATDVLLIDEALCVRCNQCEKACADSHGGTSRLKREAGPTYAQIHVPTSCRHCEHPHCMKDCPPDAIQRSANGEVYIKDSCIGCGNCERNCPYDVIQMAPVESAPQRPKLWAWLLFGLGHEPGRERGYDGVSDPDARKQAVKCDMCKDLSGGPACVRACPTGAAIRISPEKFLDLAAARDED